MQHFYFNLCQAGSLVCPDATGADFDSVEAAYLEAFRSAQELWPILLQDRRDPRGYTFEITNHDGAVLIEVPFSELLDACHDARPAGLMRPGPAFNKQAFLEAVENVRQLMQGCAELNRQLEATRRSVIELKTLPETVLSKRSEGD